MIPGSCQLLTAARLLSGRRLAIAGLRCPGLILRSGRVRRFAVHAELEMYPHGLQPVTGGKTMASTLKRLGAVRTDDIGTSQFVKPLGIYYELDGKERKWDMVTTHPSVGIIVYHREKQGVLVVRQFRPPVYVALQQEAEALGKPAPGLEAAFTLELCAGLIDKEKSLQEIAADEVLEECGYKVDPKDVVQVTSYQSAIGFSGSRHSMYYVEVDESMRVDGSGGGLHDTGESIEILNVPLASADAVIADDSLAKSPGLMFGLLWLERRQKERGLA